MTLTGGGGTPTGTGYADTIRGGAGNDTNGGAGNDTITTALVLTLSTVVLETTPSQPAAVATIDGGAGADDYRFIRLTSLPVVPVMTRLTSVAAV